MARNFHHDTLTRVLCYLAGDLEAVQCALCVSSHWHLLGKDPSLWIALRRARWGQNQIEGEGWQENPRWEYTRRASGLGLQGGEAEEVNVSECLGIERRFSGVFELHASGLALTVVAGKVVLLDLNKGKSFGFDAVTLEFNQVCPYPLNAPPFCSPPHPVKLSSARENTWDGPRCAQNYFQSQLLQRGMHSIRCESLGGRHPTSPRRSPANWIEASGTRMGVNSSPSSTSRPACRFQSWSTDSRREVHEQLHRLRRP